MAATDISVGVDSSSGSRKRRSVVTITRDETGILRMRCTCMAATRYGELCHHRLQIASGDIAFAADQPEVDLLKLRQLVREAPWYTDAHRLYGMMERREGMKSLTARALRISIATRMNGFPPKPRDKKLSAHAAPSGKDAGATTTGPIARTVLESLSFAVRLPDETGPPPTLTFSRGATPADSRFTCTCPTAATTNRLCAHRLRIASGDFAVLADPAAVDLARLTRLLLAAPWWDDLIELEWLTSARLTLRRPGHVADLRRAIAAAMSGPAVPAHPGEILAAEFLAPLGLSAGEVARDLDVPASLVARILSGHAPVTAGLALGLARLLDTTAEFWMGLQTSHDLARARAESPAPDRPETSGHPEPATP